MGIDEKMMQIIATLAAIAAANQCDGVSYRCNFGDGSGSISGTVVVEQCGSLVLFTGDISSGELADGDHGFHIHQSPNVTQCSDAGGHFKSSEDEIHGAKENMLPDRHAGDLGSVASSGGTMTINVTDAIVSLDPNSPTFIGDRSIVVHAQADDGNPTRDPTSTGAAGARVGCCRLEASSAIQLQNAAITLLLIILPFMM